MCEGVCMCVEVCAGVWVPVCSSVYRCIQVCVYRFVKVPFSLRENGAACVCGEGLLSQRAHTSDAVSGGGMMMAGG